MAEPGTVLACVVAIISGMSGAGVKLAYEDFLLFPDDGKRHELIDGEHYVTASPSTRHQRISGNLHWLMRSYLEEELSREKEDVLETPLLPGLRLPLALIFKA